MKRRTFLVSLASFGVTACAKTDEPVDPVWGKEPCAHCAMVVGDKRHAAQVGGDGQRRYFDDIGCMASWLEKNQAPRAWVREEDGRWVDAKTARYVDDAKTPMDFGFEPARSGMSWDELRSRLGKEKRGSR